MESCKETDIGKNVEIPGESLLNTKLESISEQEFVVESISDSKDKEFDAFHLDVLLAIVDSEKE